MQKIIVALALAIYLSAAMTVQAAQVLFTPALVFSEEYTDNLFLDSEDEEDDFIASAGLDLNGQLLWKTAGIELNYSPTYNSYTVNEDFNYWRHLASLSTWKVFARNTRLEFRDTHLRTNDPTDESPTTVVDGQPQAPDLASDRNRRGRNEYETNVAEARLTHQFGASDRIAIAYEYSTLTDIDFEDEDRVDDNIIVTPSIELVYNFNPKWSSEFNYSFASTDYKDELRNDRGEYNGNIRLLYRFKRSLSGYVDYRQTNLDYDRDVDADYVVSEPSIGIRYDFQNDARIEIGIGYYVQDLEGAEGEEGFNVTSDLNKRWNSRSGYFGLTGGSGYVVDDDGIQDNGLNIYYEAGIEVGYSFSSRLSGTAEGAYRYDLYPNQIPENEEETISAGLGLNWQARQWMAIALSYDFTDVSSDLEIDEYTENRMMLTIRIVPSSPFRLN